MFIGFIFMNKKVIKFIYLSRLNFGFSWLSLYHLVSKVPSCNILSSIQIVGHFSRRIKIVLFLKVGASNIFQDDKVLRGKIELLQQG
jgi:hypothetical protein